MCLCATECMASSILNQLINPHKTSALISKGSFLEEPIRRAWPGCTRSSLPSDNNAECLPEAAHLKIAGAWGRYTLERTAHRVCLGLLAAAHAVVTTSLRGRAADPRRHHRCYVAMYKSCRRSVVEALLHCSRQSFCSQISPRAQGGKVSTQPPSPRFSNSYSWFTSWLYCAYLWRVFLMFKESEAH